MAEKDTKWITVKGTSIPLDEEGNLQGKVGKKIEKQANDKIIIPYQKPSKPFSEYLKENGNDKEKAAHQFFRENLQDKSVRTKINDADVDIVFTGGTWQEFKRGIKSQNHKKAELLEDVPDVLQHYKGKNGLRHPSNKFSDFHYFEKTVEKGINGKKVKARVSVDVGVRKENKSLQAYSYFVATDSTIKTEKSHDERRRNTYYQNNKHRKGLPPRLSSMAFDKNIPQQGEIVNIDIEILEDKAMGRQNIIMDSQSKRSIDRNGFMHVELCNITKESVDPYFGREIPRHRELGLDPETIYYGWRKGDELEKAARTFCGLPLMREHHFDSSEAPQREHRVGSVGTDCAWKAPYLTATLTVTDAEAIRKIESGERMELSSGYFFTPVFEKGEWNGQPYDFIMTDIQGNHVALVEEGRAGSDVCVADTAENIKPIKTNEDKAMSQMEKEKTVPAADMETAAGAANAASEDAKTVCDSETAENKTAEQPAQDEDMDLEDILQAAGITPSDELKKVFMAGMQYAAKKQEQPAQPAPEPAKDEEMKQPEPKTSEQPAMDANTIKKQIREEMRGVQIAMREVRPLVGDLDGLAFDSAEGVYLKACELMGVTASKATARDVCRALAVTGKNPQGMFAMDSAADYGFKSRFEI